MTVSFAVGGSNIGMTDENESSGGPKQAEQP